MDERTVRTLAQRREIRPQYVPESPISDLLAGVRRDVRRAPGVAAAWTAAAPEELREMAQVIGLVRGVLTLRVRDSAAHFEVDQWLRQEGRGMLIAAASAPIKRIKLVK